MRPQDQSSRPLVGFHSFTPFEKSEAERQQAAGLNESFRILNQLIADADNLPNANAGANVATDSPAPQQVIAHESTPRPRRRAPRLDLHNPRAAQPTESALERHERKCKICRHPDREEIESDFLHWHDLSGIVNEFGLGNRRALYRHARATGLYELRMSNIRDAAALIAAQAEYCKATATSVLKAIQACSQIDELGRWVAPPARTIRYTVIGEPSADVARAAAPAPIETLAPPPSAEISNRHTMQLEFAATPTKHSPPPVSNRPKPHTFANTWTRLFHPQKSAPQQEAPRP